MKGGRDEGKIQRGERANLSWIVGGTLFEAFGGDEKAIFVNF